jgi:hypothetical protein
MPKYPPTVLPLPWQVVERPDGWWLQTRHLSGTWSDVAGPYTQRWTAVQRWQRETDKRDQEQEEQHTSPDGDAD